MAEASANGVSPLDQRSVMTLVDPTHDEMLGRLPAGIQPKFAAVFSMEHEWKKEGERLSALAKMPENARGDVRVLKGLGKPSYIQRGKEVVALVPKIYSVISGVQLPFYIEKAKQSQDELEKWLRRMYRLYIGEDGQGRKEFVEGLTLSQPGQMLKPGVGTSPLIFGIAPPPKAPKPKSIFSGGLRAK